MDPRNSFRFDELIERHIIEMIRTQGPMRKGLLVAQVMNMRGLKPDEKNVFVRMHIDALERRGILTLSSAGKRSIIVSMTETTRERGSHDQPVPLPENESHQSQSTTYISEVHSTSHDLFREVIFNLALRIHQIAEIITTENEAIGCIIRDLSVLREQIAELSRAMNTCFTQQDEASAHQHAEVLCELSAIKDKVMNNNPTSDNAAIFAALEDLQQKLKDPNEVMSRLGSSHTMLRQLLADQNDTL